MEDTGQQVDEFVASHPEKQVVVVQGLGFVGAVMAMVVANAPYEEYAVIGVDLPTDEGRRKVEALNSGTFPIESADPTVDDLHEQALEQGNFLATYSERAYEVADIVVVDINLDVEKNTGSQRALQGYDVDLTPFESACRTIAERCSPDTLVIVETTVPPGTCRNVVKPIFDKAFEERGLQNQYRLGHSFERVMPGPDYVDSIRNFYRVYAGIDEKSADATRDFLETIIYTDEYPLTRLGNTTASEMTKVLENSYRAMNIAFVQEWTEFAEEMGVNLYEVVEAIRKRPTHRNLMFPGLGVGGYCLTKDPLLASWARSAHGDGGKTATLTQSETAVEINDRMPRHTFDRLQAALDETVHGKTVLLLGVSYRKDVGDTRYTPAEYLYDLLQEHGATVRLHDPYVKHWEERDRAVEQDLEAVLTDGLDAVVFSTPHSEYEDNAELHRRLHALSHVIVVHDAWGVLSDGELGALQSTHRVQVTGRGDLNSSTEDSFPSLTSSLDSSATDSSVE
ncbi:nucleotide sugar dehydrogenase [Salinibacter ruber]|uniref:Nucleotide sugar dehydrogenase n=1 Tax=Salinibacter ruber TaxID=146919 RepID=A0A9X2V7E9_9BACT|nr:nucleotide sugar dehydrogenase [Salinibacter ruber]MCS4122751.1 nucleotide sugar dehydrogenase [Salinibacter ruber]